MAVKLLAMKLSELAAQTQARVEGNADIEIVGAAGLDEAASGQITFLSNPRYTLRVGTTRASAIYASEEAKIDRDGIAILRAKDPYLAFTRALILFSPKPSFEPSIDPTAVIDSTAQ